MGVNCYDNFCKRTRLIDLIQLRQVNGSKLYIIITALKNSIDFSRLNVRAFETSNKINKDIRIGSDIDLNDNLL